ncbi:MAG: response regulator [Candidatus Aminicenantales bacterium]
MGKILIVDDEATITTHLEEKLSRMGYSVVGRASSGEEAVKIAAELRPDLVLMDIVMAGSIDGIEAARLINEKWRIPSVFLTAYGDDKYIARAKTAEPLGYIVKPFQDSALRASIEVALYNRRVAQQLRESEEKWRQLAENIQAGIILADDRGYIFFWNKRASDIFGREPSEAIGQSLTFILPENARKALRKEIEGYALTGKSSRRDEWAEVVGLRKDWSKFPLELCLTPWSVQGKSVWVCLARDFSERKRTEDGIKASLREKERLLDEVQGQIKKSLQAVFGLVDLQFEYLRGQKIASSARDSRKRIQSIARLYERLSPGETPSRIHFGGYIRSLAERLFEAFRADQERIRLRLEIDPLDVDIKTAMACGLITSELVSNSLKYAFPEKKVGEIVIEFHSQAGGRFELAIKDNGVGLPADVDPRSPRSLGWQIVNDLVAQLGGKMRVGRKDGAKFTISFPETSR